MPVNSVKKLLFFFTIYYFAQGTYFAYGGFEQPFLRANGVSLTSVSGVKSVAIVPWSIKLLFAVPCDMIGRRLPFSIVGMLLGASALVSISTFDPAANLPLYTGTVFMRNFGIAISDVAVDGMAVDCGLQEQTGMVQAFMSFGRVSGTLLGSAIGGPLTNISYSAMIIYLAVVVYVIVPVNFFVKEERKGNSDAFEWSAFKELFRPSFACFLGWACFGNIAGGMGSVPSTEWADTIVGLTSEQFGYLTVVGSVGDLIGALTLGFLFDRMDKRWAMLITTVIQAASAPLSLLAREPSSWFALSWFGGIGSGASFVTACGLAMALADKRTGASTFAIVVSVLNFSTMIGNAIGGPLAEQFSLETMFWVSFVVQMLQLFFIPFVHVVVKKGDDDPLASLPPIPSVSEWKGASSSNGGDAAAAKTASAGAGDEDGENISVITNVLHTARLRAKAGAHGTSIGEERMSNAVEAMGTLPSAGNPFVPPMPVADHHQHHAAQHKDTAAGEHHGDVHSHSALPGAVAVPEAPAAVAAYPPVAVEPAAPAAASTGNPFADASAAANTRSARVAAALARSAGGGNPFGAPASAGNPFASLDKPPAASSAASSAAAAPPLPPAAQRGSNPFGPAVAGNPFAAAVAAAAAAPAAAVADTTTAPQDE